MQTNFLIPLLFGVLLGIFGVLLVLPFRARKKTQEIRPQNVMMQGVNEILEVLGPSALIVNGSNYVIRATTAAIALGLVDGRALGHKRLSALVDKARETEEVLSIEASLPTGRRDSKLFVAARAKSLGEGNVLLIVDDRTESQRLDEMRKDFMANISHELKTPIGAVGLLSEAMENSLDQPDLLPKLVKNIRKESQRLSSLVQDIIQLSRIQSVSKVATSNQINLVDAVKEAIDRNSWRSEKHEVTIEFETEKPRIDVIGDSEMLTVAIKNLIENAIIYSNAGASVAVVIETKENLVEIRVKDSGIGIAKEDLTRIFERFYRVDQSRSRETGGTGLGLSIVKHAALTHHGDVQLFSKPGIGSTFTLRLPAVDRKVSKLIKRKASLG
jgi:two-component system sensor histidine kinase SenX3